MRCDLAASLLHEPPLLFLDEPTIGLDVVAKANVRAFLKEANKLLETTVILTTHDLDDIEELCERVVLIDHGQVLWDGSLRGLRDRHLPEARIRFDLNQPPAGDPAELAVGPWRATRLSPGRYQLVVDKREASPADVLREVVRDLPVLDLAVGEPDIEEVVARIYRENAALRKADGRRARPRAPRPASSSTAASGGAEAAVTTLALARPYLAFARTSFLNILAYRARYFVGILTYFFNATVWYYIWRALFHEKGAGATLGGFTFPQMLTYVATGWALRSFYFNEVDREIASQVREGRLAMTLIKPVDVQAMTLSQALGESAFRLVLFTLPIGLLLGLVYPLLPPASAGGLRPLPPLGPPLGAPRRRDQLLRRPRRHPHDVDPRRPPRQVPRPRAPLGPPRPGRVLPRAGPEGPRLAPLPPHERHARGASGSASPPAPTPRALSPSRPGGRSSSSSSAASSGRPRARRIEVQGG